MEKTITLTKEFENEFGTLLADRKYRIFTIVPKNTEGDELEEVKKFLRSVEERVDLLHEEADTTDDMSVRQDFVDHFSAKLLMSTCDFVHENEQPWDPIKEAFMQMMKAQGLDFENM